MLLTFQLYCNCGRGYTWKREPMSWWDEELFSCFRLTCTDLIPQSLYFMSLKLAEAIREYGGENNWHICEDSRFWINLLVTFLKTCHRFKLQYFIWCFYSFILIFNFLKKILRWNWPSWCKGGHQRCFAPYPDFSSRRIWVWSHEGPLWFVLPGSVLEEFIE